MRDASDAFRIVRVQTRHGSPVVGPTLGRPDTKGKEEREYIDGSDIEVRAVFACGAIIRGSDRRVRGPSKVSSTGR